jgi:hypothetical protein
MQCEVITKSRRPQLKLQLLEQSSILLYTPCLLQPQQLIPQLQLPIQICELFSQLGEENVQGQIFKNFDTIVRVRTPPCQGVSPKICHHQSTRRRPFSHPYSVKILFHHKEPVLQLTMPPTKSAWLFNFYLPRY